MKKMIAMILALMTVLSLCACGANQPAPETGTPATSASQTTQPAVTQPAATQPEATQPQIPGLDLFVGTWRIVEETFLTKVATFTIHEDGTLEAGGEILTWTAQEAHPDRSYDMILKVQSSADSSNPNSLPTWAFDLYLTRTPENTFVAEMRRSQMATTGDVFYREGDYEVVELNDGNAMEYLQQVPEYNAFQKKSDQEYSVVRSGKIQLKEGLGALSYCTGTFIFDVTYVEMFLTEAADGFTEGKVTGTTVDDQSTFDTIRIGAPREYNYTLYWFGTQGSAGLKLPGNMECRQLTGTKGASGYIFIPV